MAAALGIQGNVGGGGNAAFKVCTCPSYAEDQSISNMGSRTKRNRWRCGRPISWLREPWPMPSEPHSVHEVWTK